MKASTAIGLLAMGLSLLLVDVVPERRDTAGCGFGGGVGVLIGVLTVAEYLLGRSLGIDELAFRDVGALATVHPGRLAPQTAIDFVWPRHGADRDERAYREARSG